MSIESPTGILDIRNAILKVSKLEVTSATGFDTALNNIARNTILLVDATEQTSSNSWALKLPNAWVGEFEGYWSSGASGNIDFNIYNNTTSGTNGYTLSMDDTTIVVKYDGTTLQTTTISSTLKTSAYRKVSILFERDTISVAIDGKNELNFKDSSLRARVYDDEAGGYITVAGLDSTNRKFKNLKVVNEKWISDGTSNIAYMGGNVGVSGGNVGIGITAPTSNLHVVGNAYVSSNLQVGTANLFVDTTTGRVGIGKTDPAYAIDIDGTVNATSLYVGGAPLSAGFDPDVTEIAIGSNAATFGQNTNSIAIGSNAATFGQYTESVAIGLYAGESNQKDQSIAIGDAAGRRNQGSGCVAIGATSGNSTQGTHAVAIGIAAGATSQGSQSVAIGYIAGAISQGSQSVAIGDSAGYTSQGSICIAIGYNAGKDTQGSQSVAIGYAAGESTQTSLCVAIGYNAGWRGQGTQSVAMGHLAGENYQGPQSIAIGRNAARLFQGFNCVAIGTDTAQYNQGDYATALGVGAGATSQGNYAIAIGYLAGLTNQPASTFYVGLSSIRAATGNYYLHYNTSTGEISSGNSYSDDRLKYNEKIITGAIKSLFKLRPEEYDKKPSLKPSHSGEEWKRESGLIAQEIFYNAPEFRHIVQVPQSAGDVENYTPPPSDDPNQDPDYSVWGPEPAAVRYEQFVPYLIKAVQEIVTELPRSKTTVSNTRDQNITGLVVSANTNTHKTNTTPIVTLSNVYMDKAWYGVVSMQKTDTNDYDTLVDTKGDTQIWVTDVAGSLVSGDLVTTSNIAPGFTQKQSDDLFRSYTVAKMTQDCDFTEPTRRAIKVPKQELSNVTYYTRTTEQNITLDAYEKLYDTYRKIKTEAVYFRECEEGEGASKERYFHGETEVSIFKYEKLSEDERSMKWIDEVEIDKYEKLDEEEKAKYTLGTRDRWFVLNLSKSKTPIPEHDEEIVVEELVDVLDENGQIVWEETGETEPVYTLVDHGTYKAALVTAKLV